MRLARRNKKDANHAAFSRVFKRFPGLDYRDTSNVGDGFPDFLVAWNGLNILVEVKNPDDPRMTAEEGSFFMNWPGIILVVESVDELLYHLNALQETPHLFTLARSFWHQYKMLRLPRLKIRKAS